MVYVEKKCFDTKSAYVKTPSLLLFFLSETLAQFSVSLPLGIKPSFANANVKQLLLGIIQRKIRDLA